MWQIKHNVLLIIDVKINFRWPDNLTEAFCQRNWPDDILEIVPKVLITALSFWPLGPSIRPVDKTLPKVRHFRPYSLFCFQDIPGNFQMSQFGLYISTSIDLRNWKTPENNTVCLCFWHTYFKSWQHLHHVHWSNNHW